MKKLWISASFIILSSASVILFFTYPRHISQSIKGVEYQLGTEHHHITPVTLKITGTLHRPLMKKRTFKGTIRIEGVAFPNPDNNKQITIKFDRNGLGIMMYGYDKNGTPITHSYGALFTDNNFKKVTIEEFRPGKGWNGRDGFMISAPAVNRAQALNISNTLMRRFLNGYTLK